MTTSYPPIPTHDDWKRIYDSSPFERIYSLLDRFHAFGSERLDFDTYIVIARLDTLYREVQQRIGDAAKSYMYMIFFYELGIPDNRWFISPGSHGESVQFFPDFEEKHWLLKDWFDLYSDMLYYKVFSAWDALGHVLNVNFDLNIERVDFGKAVKKLKSKDATLYIKLTKIQDSTAFKQAQKIRHDITHNNLPNVPGMKVHIEEKPGVKVTSFGLSEYVCSNEIVANTHQILDLFATTLDEITAKFNVATS